MEGSKERGEVVLWDPLMPGPSPALRKNMPMVPIESVNLFFAGLLAGEELVVRYGLSGPLAKLDDKPHIQLRQSLIRRLRIFVPSLFILAVSTGVSALIVDRTHPGFAFRCAGMLALLVFITVTLLGTVPINKAALGWDASAPPAGWKLAIERWRRRDTFRCWAAILAFALFLAGAA
jgi:uncharacterized membrane protein